MNTIEFFWYSFNWLEFVTYILIPLAMILMIVVYIVSNLKLIELCFNFDENNNVNELEWITNNYLEWIDKKWIKQQELLNNEKNDDISIENDKLNDIVNDFIAKNEKLSN